MCDSYHQTLFIILHIDQHMYTININVFFFFLFTQLSLYSPKHIQGPFLPAPAAAWPAPSVVSASPAARRPSFFAHHGRQEAAPSG